MENGEQANENPEQEFANPQPERCNYYTSRSITNAKGDSANGKCNNDYHQAGNCKVNKKRRHLMIVCKWSFSISPA